MAHYMYVFILPWHITHMCLFQIGTLHMCVCPTMEHYAVMKKWRWVFMNCFENKSLISTAAEFLKMCQEGTVAKLCLGIVLKVLLCQRNKAATLNIVITFYLIFMAHRTLLIDIFLTKCEFVCLPLMMYCHNLVRLRLMVDKRHLSR
jgi:hypothetical protein